MLLPHLPSGGIEPFSKIRFYDGHGGYEYRLPVLVPLPLLLVRDNFDGSEDAPQANPVCACTDEDNASTFLYVGRENDYERGPVLFTRERPDVVLFFDLNAELPTDCAGELAGGQGSGVHFSKDEIGRTVAILHLHAALHTLGITAGSDFEGEVAVT